MVRSTVVLLGAVAALGLGATGCNDCGGAPGSAASGAASGAPTGSGSAGASPAASAEEARPAWLGIASAPSEVAKVLNPKGQDPHAGPTATLRGRITIEGDPPPPTTLSIPPECAKASDTYGVLFRAAKDGALADALVAVTGYDAFVPPAAPAVKVELQGCAFDRRTVAMTYGQRIEVENEDAVASYMPYLDGSPFEAIMVAVPRGAPVKLSPLAPGQYLLRDAMKRPFLLADVFVLKYATAAVTGVDGRYVIERLPVGKVRVDALLPVIRKTTGKDVELKPGDNVLDLVLTHDASKDRPAPVPAPVWGTRVPAPPASAAPSSPP